jgi:hypothetical protein
MLDSLLAELRAAGHLHGDVPPPAEAAEANVSYWILALQVIGGWLAALFMLLFLGMGAAPLIKGATGWIIVGLTMTALTGLLMMRVEGTVLRQFLLVASLAGHGALIVGAGDIGKGGSGSTIFTLALLMLAVYEIALLLWVAWMPHRLIAALVAAGALVIAGGVALSAEVARCWAGVYWLAACLFWLFEARCQAQRHGEACHALACALTLLCFAYALTGFLSHDLFALDVMSKKLRFDAALVCAVNMGLVLWLARPLLSNVRQLCGVFLLLAALGITWQAPAVGMGALALVFGFARSHRWLMWLGGALLLFGVGRFYYDLRLTLLDKSGLMVLGGAALLAVRALLVGHEELS